MQNQVNSLIISYPSRIALGNTFSFLHNPLSQVGFFKKQTAVENGVREVYRRVLSGSRLARE